MHPSTSPVEQEPRPFRTAAGALGVVILVLVLVPLAATPAWADSIPTQRSDGTYVLTPSTGNQVACQVGTSNVTAGFYEHPGAGVTTYIACYYDPSIDFDTLTLFRIHWRRQSGSGMCGSTNQTWVFNLVTPTSNSSYDDVVHAPGDPGPSGAALPEGAFYVERQHKLGPSCELTPEHDPTYEGFQGQLSVGTTTHYWGRLREANWITGGSVPAAAKCNTRALQTTDLPSSPVRCWHGTEVSGGLEGPSFPEWRYSVGSYVRGGSNECSDLTLYPGGSDDPADTFTDGQELHFDFTWNIPEGTPRGGERIASVTFNPGDGGPSVTVSEPQWLTDNGLHHARFTIIKNGDGTLEGAVVSCRDTAGGGTERPIDEVPDGTIDDDESGELTLESCVGELVRVGLNPSSWLPGLVKAVGCTLHWAFVPPPSHLELYAERLGTAYEESALQGVTASADSVVDALGELDQGSGPCAGPTVDIPQLSLVDMAPLSACSGTSGGSFAPIIKTGLSALLVAGAVFAAIRMLSGAFGFQDVEPGWDWDGRGNTAKVYDYT